MNGHRDWGVYKNFRGIEFFITAERKQEPEGAAYRLWTVRARNAPAPDAPSLWFRVFVTTTAYPEENLAEMTARGPALDYIKTLLEMATETGRPLTLGHEALHEGWAVV